MISPPESTPRIFKFLNRFGEGSYIVDVDLHKALSIMDASYHSRRDAARFNVVGRCGVYFEGSLLLDVDASVSPDVPIPMVDEGISGCNGPTLFVGRLDPAAQNSRHIYASWKQSHAIDVGRTIGRHGNYQYIHFKWATSGKGLSNYPIVGIQTRVKWWSPTVFALD